MVVRIFVGFLLMAIAAVFIAFAGGVDVFSLGGWKAVGAWAMPAKADTERCLALLVGTMFVMMSLIRLLRSGPKPMMPRRVEA